MPPQLNDNFSSKTVISFDGCFFFFQKIEIYSEWQGATNPNEHNINKNNSTFWPIDFFVDFSWILEFKSQKLAQMRLFSLSLPFI